MTRNDFIHRAALALITNDISTLGSSREMMEIFIARINKYADVLQEQGHTFDTEGATDDQTGLKEQLELSERFRDMYEKVADTGIEALNRLKTVLGEHPRARTNPIYRKIAEIVENARQDAKNTIIGTPLP